MKKVKLFEEFTANHVECDNCGWKWMLQDGGEDLYICHECGHDNTPVLGESLNEEEYVSPYLSGNKLKGLAYHAAGLPIKKLNSRPMWFALEQEHSDDGWYNNMAEDGGGAYQYSAKITGNIVELYSDEIEALFAENGIDPVEWETAVVGNPTAADVLNLKGTKLLIKNGVDGVIYYDYDPRDFQEELEALIVFNAAKSAKRWKMVKSED